METQNSMRSLDEYTWSPPMALALMTFEDMDSVQDYSEIGAAEAEITINDFLDPDEPIKAASRHLRKALERHELDCIACEGNGALLKIPIVHCPRLHFDFYTEKPSPDCPAGTVATCDEGLLYHSLRFHPNDVMALAGYQKPSADQETDPAPSERTMTGQSRSRSARPCRPANARKVGRKPNPAWKAAKVDSVIQAFLAERKTLERSERTKLIRKIVNSPPAKAGGFRLRLKAGSVRRLADFTGHRSYRQVPAAFGS